MKTRQRVITLSGYDIKKPEQKRVVGPLAESIKKPEQNAAEKLKNKLRGRYAHVNTTGIDYDEFVESITDVRKIDENLPTAITKFGWFALSKTPPEKLMDTKPEFINIGYNGKKFVITENGRDIYIFKIKPLTKEAAKDEPLDIPIDIDLSCLPKERIAELILNDLDRVDVAAIIAKAKGVSHTELTSTMETISEFSVRKNEYLAMPYLYVRAGTNYYAIYLKKDAQYGEFNLPPVPPDDTVNIDEKVFVVFLLKPKTNK
ncbi:MAG: hypothetical protein QW171_03065 [Candidatus Bilamarchaeaceae archaeon]